MLLIFVPKAKAFFTFIFLLTGEEEKGKIEEKGKKYGKGCFFRELSGYREQSTVVCWVMFVIVTAASSWGKYSQGAHFQATNMISLNVEVERDANLNFLELVCINSIYPFVLISKARTPVNMD